jgi:signal transduction histidine kinase
MNSLILVVDDEPASVRALQRALHEESPVMSAAGGVRALELLAAHPVTLMIADQRMPDMLGTDLLAACAARFPSVIRILLTGYTDVDTLVEAINAGHVYAYLAKPWEPGELRLAVRRGLEFAAVQAERRRLTDELAASYARVRREAEQKTRLLAVAAHELGTPLHVLANALDLLVTLPLPAAAAPWLEVAQRNALWLGRGLAQVSRGACTLPSRLQLRRQPIDVTRLLHDVQTTFASALAQRRVHVEVEMTDDLPRLNADPVWMRRALVNLVSNAIRFTPDGGTVTLAAHPYAGGVELSVADTGIGIEAHLLEEIFEPFSAAGGDLLLHASGGLEFGARGLGLGLAITRAIMKEHQAVISIESTPGTGTRVTCRFDAAAVR